MKKHFVFCMVGCLVLAGCASNEPLPTVTSRGPDTSLSPTGVPNSNRDPLGAQPDIQRDADPARPREIVP